MRVAALDLGSNTTLLLIAEVNNGQIKVLVDEARVTKLGQGVQASRRFHPEALARMRVCLSEYQALIEAHRCDKVIAVATSAARDVGNGIELVQIGAERGIPIQIISGQSEAELTFRGALFDRGDTRGSAVIDVGGGSTEIIVHSNEGVRGISVDVGSVRLTEQFVTTDPISPAELSSLTRHIDSAFNRVKIPTGVLKGAFAVAGTPTTLAALAQQSEYSEEIVHSYKLSVPLIQTWCDRLAQLSGQERRSLPGMQPGREDVIVAGTAILLGAAKALNVSELTVSTRGVRYGVALTAGEFT